MFSDFAKAIGQLGDKRFQSVLFKGLGLTIALLVAIYLVFVCILPEILVARTGVSLALGGTSLLIIVSVTLDTVSQIQGHLIAQQYEGLIKKSKLRGGKRGR